MIRSNTWGSVGIGTLIVFIAFVLVAGFAAFVIIQTGSILEIQSTQTGSETISDVSTGIEISRIQGHYSSSLIDKLVITITPRYGSPNINMMNTMVEISNTSVKCIMNYSSTYWVDGTSGLSDLFSAQAFSPIPAHYGLIILKDADSSCLASTPMINRGDSVMLALNMSSAFNGLDKNLNMFGHVIPENGMWGIIEFRTPSATADVVVTLQD